MNSMAKKVCSKTIVIQLTSRKRFFQDPFPILMSGLRPINTCCMRMFLFDWFRGSTSPPENQDFTIILTIIKSKFVYIYIYTVIYILYKVFLSPSRLEVFHDPHCIQASKILDRLVTKVNSVKASRSWLPAVRVQEYKRLRTEERLPKQEIQPRQQKHVGLTWANRQWIRGQSSFAYICLKHHGLSEHENKILGHDGTLSRSAGAHRLCKGLLRLLDIHLDF